MCPEQVFQTGPWNSTWWWLPIMEFTQDPSLNFFVELKGLKSRLPPLNRPSRTTFIQWLCQFLGSLMSYGQFYANSILEKSSITHQEPKNWKSHWTKVVQEGRFRGVAAISNLNSPQKKFIDGSWADSLIVTESGVKFHGSVWNTCSGHMEACYILNKFRCALLSLLYSASNLAHPVKSYSQKPSGASSKGGGCRRERCQKMN